MPPAAFMNTPTGLSAKVNSAALAAGLGVLTLTFGVVGLMFWSTSSVDELAGRRQHKLVAKVLAESTVRIAHDQEGVTVWDDAVNEVRRERLDLDWLDQNVGIWMHGYYGHDAAFVLDPANRPIYSMIEGARRTPQDFASMADEMIPLVADLRELQQAADTDLPEGQLTPGVTDILMVNAHPSVVSVKPIVSDTGEIEQPLGKEFVHISVRRLDGSFIEAVRGDYGIEDARFVHTAALRPGETAQPLRSRAGDIIGYIAWRPFQPGQTVFMRLAPVFMSAAALMASILFLLMRRVARRTRELNESNAAVEHLAFHDVLTGLPNRALFEDRLTHALAVLRRTAERPVALLFLDLDRFKMVNDTLGHAAGDELIREFARRLSSTIRASDTAARLGGDEFAIIQTDISSADDIEDLCKRIVKSASEPFLISGSRVHIGVSIGVALAGKDGLDAEELARCADIALYEVKAQGRGHYVLFNPVMDEPIRARQHAEKDLRAALDAGDQLSLVYQPTYSAADGSVAGVEALLRWQHPESGNVPPAVFIPMAEEIGLIEPLGDWVLAQACRDARAWPIPTISINVSPVQLRNPLFARRTMSIIQDAGIDPGRLELEVTETAVMEQAGQCALNLRMLREFGIRVALDDFGTGYSSFSHFNALEVDRVKIDRTFVARIDDQGGGSAIIQAIVKLAHASGFRITAEGVETDDQKTFLERIGCDDLQGFLLDYPMNAGEIGTRFGTGETQSSEALTI
ncbi:putative bifunctional diguanylate cyclase/phosphodiesterase [Altericroceibacterium xinjiangense]|uniref:putative bifunctional diguanylate cyclase/phosphodiesterase n=1 Tax=Altericroceibacterium xinjiangense TaxID=762261 RepID=UPI000F7DE638|nr:EAL domain-containing protein [Altericroceibacterium xinjiangense]